MMQGTLAEHRRQLPPANAQKRAGMGDWCLTQEDNVESETSRERPCETKRAVAVVAVSIRIDAFVKLENLIL